VEDNLEVVLHILVVEDNLEVVLDVRFVRKLDQLGNDFALVGDRYVVGEDIGFENSEEHFDYFQDNQRSCFASLAHIPFESILKPPHIELVLRHLCYGK
jgi:hypothetical protein